MNGLCVAISMLASHAASDIFLCGAAEEAEASGRSSGEEYSGHVTLRQTSHWAGRSSVTSSSVRSVSAPGMRGACAEIACRDRMPVLLKTRTRCDPTKATTCDDCSRCIEEEDEEEDCRSSYSCGIEEERGFEVAGAHLMRTETGSSECRGVLDRDAANPAVCGTLLGVVAGTWVNVLTGPPVG